MDDEELSCKLHRIYAAINANEEKDLNKIKPAIVQNQSFILFHQDFRGGLKDPDLSNLAYSLIHNIANLKDILKKWAIANNRDKAKIEQAVNRSFDLQIIIDLSNNDKHGYPPRDGGYSGKSPNLVEINRVLQLKAGGNAGNYITVKSGDKGMLEKSGPGIAKVILTGNIVDKDGNHLGALEDVALEAIEVWNHVLKEFDIALPE